MNGKSIGPAFVLGFFIFAGLALLGYLAGNGVVRLRAMDRTVIAKGLSEREMPTNIAIWPIRFSVVDNDLTRLYSAIQTRNSQIAKFLATRGFTDAEISFSTPQVSDKETMSRTEAPTFRYSGSSTVIVYSEKVEDVRRAMQQVAELGKLGIVISGDEYSFAPSFLFTKLNDIKPQMIEEATKNAREVAEKFAKDSGSTLGRIKSANQGAFQIDDRDESTPHIKRVRIVCTVTYYLSD